MNREIGDLKKILKLADRKISSVEFEFEIRQHQMNREMGDLKKKLQIADGKISSSETRQHQMNKEMGDIKKKLAEEKIFSAKRRLSAAEMSGSWCASQDRWSTESAVITFDNILHEDSNMNRNALNTGTGKNDEGQQI